MLDPKPHLNPQKTDLLKDLHKEFIVWNPKKVGSLDSRSHLGSSLKMAPVLGTPNIVAQNRGGGGHPYKKDSKRDP